MKKLPPHPLGWPETWTLADGRTVTGHASRSSQQATRFAHLCHLLGARERADYDDGYHYADHLARKAREYAAEDAEQQRRSPMWRPA